MMTLKIQILLEKWRSRRFISEHGETVNTQTVNLLAYAYAGSNPALPTIFTFNG